MNHTLIPIAHRGIDAAAVLRPLLARCSRWLQTRRRFAELQDLDDRTLRDIGVHRSELLSVAHGRDPGRLRMVRT